MALLQIAAVSLLVAAFQLAVVDACRSDYTFIPTLNSYYKHHQEKVTWTKARDTCKEEGALLFYPEDTAELELVWTVMNIGNNSGWWLNVGFSDLDKQGDYRTVDGRRMNRVPVKGDPANPDKMRCGAVEVVGNKYHELIIHQCEDHIQPYVCKRVSSAAAQAFQTANGEVKAIIANSSDKLSGVMERQALIQSTLLGRLVEAVGRQNEIQQNQTVVLEQLQKAVANQATASNRQSEIVQSQFTNILAAIDHQTANITAALEKLASSEAENMINAGPDQ